MGELIPILGILFVLGPPATFLFSFTPIGKALVHRIKGGGSDNADQLEEVQQELAESREALFTLQDEIVELGERVSFAERLVSNRNEAPLLARPKVEREIMLGLEPSVP
jgi:hypothetical protein